MPDQLPTSSVAAQFKQDCDTLTVGELRKKYPSEYGSWKSMNERHRTGRRNVEPAFKDFREFLRSVGPKDGTVPLSIDRKDTNNPTYGPGLAKWSTAKEQANNRSTTIFLTVDGETLPLTYWAEKTGQKPDTLRKRHKRGHSDQEVVFGRLVVELSGQWPGPQTPERLKWLEAKYRTRRDPRQTRLDFFDSLAIKEADAANERRTKLREIVQYLREGKAPARMHWRQMEEVANKALQHHSVADMEKLIQEEDDHIKRLGQQLREAARMRSPNHAGRGG